MVLFRDVHHFRVVFKNWTIAGSDKRLQDFLFQKSYKKWYNDPTAYPYWFLSFVCIGITLGMGYRTAVCHPDVSFRHENQVKYHIDRKIHNMYAIPFYNTTIKNFALLFTGSFVDNEHDYASAHPWNCRPERGKYYARFPFIFSAPKYFVDEPDYENTLHSHVENRYKELGYYGVNN
ncbi:conserved Plasmodium protein, unknown function [Babesia microti strain RI]|uniref:Uncharacterized protein n=1 Tax=Babesia microti (strain RI) TaxID=1133968 RepID=A0A1N6LYC7_BABMR|nr:conserved Plasmodium protein, unknown function [Babesia microti strain RI]SIO73886.1 conserved Plasmodium protein, unknown function [Babesia microti strain RI]|eukprot:XP_021337937.1 conserved Plasmodium protein, unknown function [Babesia microti strain RI]